MGKNIELGDNWVSKMKKLVKINIYVRHPRVIMKNFEGESDEDIIDKALDYAEGITFEYPEVEYDAKIYNKKYKPRVRCKKCGKNKIEAQGYSYNDCDIKPLCIKCFYKNIDEIQKTHTLKLKEMGK